MLELFFTKSKIDIAVDYAAIFDWHSTKMIARICRTNEYFPSVFWDNPYYLTLIKWIFELDTESINWIIKLILYGLKWLILIPKSCCAKCNWYHIKSLMHMKHDDSASKMHVVVTSHARYRLLACWQLWHSALCFCYPLYSMFPLCQLVDQKIKK